MEANPRGALNPEVLKACLDTLQEYPWLCDSDGAVHVYRLVEEISKTMALVAYRKGLSWNGCSGLRSDTLYKWTRIQAQMKVAHCTPRMEEYVK